MFNKLAMETMAAGLSHMAADCFEEARTQSSLADHHGAIADLMRASAERLMLMGRALEAEASKLQGEIARLAVA